MRCWVLGAGCWVLRVGCFFVNVLVVLKQNERNFPTKAVAAVVAPTVSNKILAIAPNGEDNLFWDANLTQ